MQLEVYFIYIYVYSEHLSEGKFLRNIDEITSALRDVQNERKICDSWYERQVEEYEKEEEAKSWSATGLNNPRYEPTNGITPRDCLEMLFR